MSKTYKITGNDAIRLAERENLAIQCHANPIDDGGPVAVGVARQIAKEDPSLIYVMVVPTGWRNSSGNHCGDEGRTVEGYFNSAGMYLGPDDEGVEPCWNHASLRQFAYATDSASGTVEAASLADAYQTMRAKITDSQVADGATLWVEDTDTGERITMAQDGEIL